MYPSPCSYLCTDVIIVAAAAELVLNVSDAYDDFWVKTGQSHVYTEFYCVQAWINVVVGPRHCITVPLSFICCPLRNAQYCSYRLEEAHIVFNFWDAEEFFGYNSPKPERILITACTPVKFFGGNPPGYHQTATKPVLFFSVTNTAQFFGHLTCTDFDHV